MKRILACLLLALCLMTACAANAETGGSLILTAINVGKADCLLLESGADVYMIDTGTAQSWGAVSAALRERNVDHLRGVIVTHADKDHAGGAEALAASSIRVDAWYTSAFCEKYKENKHPVLLAAARRGETVTGLKAGDELPLDGGRLTVLGPMTFSEEENNNSVVLLAEGGGGRMLLTGDMEFSEEEALLAAGVIPPCTVLKVGNHGENDATSQTLVNAVRPQVAVISTNSVEEPDTPAKRVLKALKAVGARVAITQSAAGAVQVELQGGKAEVTLAGRGEWPEAVSCISLADKDAAADTLCLQNSGSGPVDLSGWYIYSERGSEIFVLPDGAQLAAGSRMVISTLSSPRAGDHVWPDKKVWNVEKADAAILYDAYGRLMDRLE